MAELSIEEMEMDLLIANSQVGQQQQQQQQQLRRVFPGHFLMSKILVQILHT